MDDNMGWGEAIALGVMYGTVFTCFFAPMFFQQEKAGKKDDDQE